MFRFFLFGWIIISGMFVSSFEANAQNVGDGDQGWCTVQLGSENPTICGYQSAHEACAQQKVSFGDPFNPGATMFPTEYGERSGNCHWEPATLGAGTVSKRCNTGFVMNNGVCVEDEGLQRCGDCNHDGNQVKVGDPIGVISGANFQHRTDFETADGRLSFSRTYHSRPFGKVTRFGSPRVGLGANWLPSTDLEMRLWQSFGVSRNVELVTPNGSGFVFGAKSTGEFKNTHFDGRAPYGGGVDGWRIEHVGAWPGLGSFASESRNLKVIGPDGTIYNMVTEKIDPSDNEYLRGRVHSIIYQGGYTQTYSYDARGNLGAITDSYGRTISFTYDLVTWQRLDENNQIVEIRDQQGNLNPSRSYVIKTVSFPDGSKVDYEYNSLVPFNIVWGIPERLEVAQRTAADGTVTSERYHYEDSRFRDALTGVTDENGVRYVSWTYDSLGKTNSSELATGVDRWEVFYEKTSAQYRQRTVTNPLGKQTVYTLPGAMRATQANDLPGNNTPAATVNYGYSGVSFTSMTDKEGRQTNYSRDSIGRIISQTNAVGLPAQSTTTTEWHPQYASPTRTVEPGLTTDYSYSTAGNLLSITQSDTSGTGGGASADPRIWAFTYTGNGLNVASIDGPLPGTSDTQTFTYAGPNISSITNEVGHVTQITDHNPIGLPKFMVDPNGVSTLLDYDYDNRLIQITQDAGGTEAITTIQYDEVDNVTGVTPPNGASLTFTYDDARRLETITNAVGETITYGRNAMGGIVSTDISGTDQAIVYQLTQTFDDLNRVIETVTTGPSITGFDYDKADNLVGAIDPRGGSWSQAFDGLNRVKSETDPLGATTDYGLEAQTDARNPLTSVTDARSATTNYVRNGYGEVIREVNLEAGITEYVRDERGLVTRMTDARGVVTDYSYDAAGRPLSVSYPATPTENVNYIWDTGQFGIGQLSSVSEEYGNTDYTYNSLDQMVSMSRTIAGQVYVTSYTYDLAGEILSTTYPSGREVKLTRDAAARIVKIETKGPEGANNGETEYTVIMDAITYTAYGPLTGGVFGDGHSLSIAYDTAYRATNLSRNHAGGSALMDVGFGYDANGDILALNDNVRPERSQAFTYDAVSRLKTASGGYGDLAYDYNLGGDRTRRTADDNTVIEVEDYTYNASFRLDNVSSSLGTLRSFTYDASGQVATDDRAGEIYAYTNNNRGRPVLVTRDGVQIASYTYDDDEQRVVKSLPDGTLVHYAYDSEGRLISETDGTTGDTIREYLWLGLTPVAVIAANDNQPCDDQARIDELTALIADKTAKIATNQERIVAFTDSIADKTARIATNEARIVELGDKILDKQSRIATKEARIIELNGLITDRQARIVVNQDKISNHQTRIGELQALLAATDPANTDRIADLEVRIATRQARIVTLTTRIGELEALITAHQTRIGELEVRNTELAAQILANQTRISELEAANVALAGQIVTQQNKITDKQARIATLQAQITTHQTELDTLQAQCDAAGGTSGTGEPTLSYLHTDHLGKPQFATDTTGTVIWDAGGQVTPFGDGINLAAAFTQNLQFPGQYYDEETGLSHNHHRTYDPALGRYLQSDPIGLAGGLNRYAYVGGNPVSFVDPTGEFVPLAVVGWFVVRALAGAVTEIGLQYFTNGRRMECIDWADVGISGAVSGFVPGLKTIKDIFKYRKVAKATKGSSIAQYEMEYAIFKLAGSRVGKFVAKKKIDIKNCECE